MLQPYTDIIEGIGSPPTWWDEVGVPRYCEFHPRQLNNPYANEGILLLIACQECQKEYPVAIAWGRLDITNLDAYRELESALQKGEEPPPSSWPAMSLIQRMTNGHYMGYGDPPFACGKNCHAGYSMTSYTLAVLQVWSRDNHEWARKPDLEKVYPSIEEQINEDEV